MKKSEKLYNVIFPLWFYYIAPRVWLIALPGNLAIDSLILLICMHAFKLADKGRFYLKHILPIVFFGFLADFIGSWYLIFMATYVGDTWPYILSGVAVAAVFIFLFNYFITFRKTEKKARLWISLIFAVATAPYTYFLDSSIFG